MTIIQKPKTIRAFVSINLPSNIRHTISQKLNDLNVIQLAESKTRLKPVNPDNFHMTIAFLGDVTIDKINRLIIDINAGLKKYAKPIKCQIKSINGFPKIDDARLIYLVVESPELMEIADNVRKIILNNGFDLDFSFKPHITVSRFASKIPLEISQKDIDSLNLKFSISSVHLMQSVLSPVGAIYSKIETFDLLK